MESLYFQKSFFVCLWSWHILVPPPPPPNQTTNHGLPRRNPNTQTESPEWFPVQLLLLCEISRESVAMKNRDLDWDTRIGFASTIQPQGSAQYLARKTQHTLFVVLFLELQSRVRLLSFAIIWYLSLPIKKSWFLSPIWRHWNSFLISALSFQSPTVQPVGDCARGKFPSWSDWPFWSGWELWMPGGWAAENHDNLFQQQVPIQKNNPTCVIYCVL